MVGALYYTCNMYYLKASLHMQCFLSAWTFGLLAPFLDDVGKRIEYKKPSSMVVTKHK